MADADDIAKMKKMAEDQKKTADATAATMKKELNERIAAYDKQMSELQRMKSEAQADLRKL